MSEHIVKIQKLMAMADHVGSNPNEAAAAAAMAARLAAKHNIDLDAVRTADQPKTFARLYTEIKVPMRDEQAFYFLCNAVAKTYGCVGGHFIFSGSIEPVFVGQPHNTGMAKSWFQYLWDACKLANRIHAREQNYGSHARREQARSAFRYGFCKAVSERMHELLMATMAQTHTSTHTGGTALVVGAWFESERRDVAQWMADDAAARAERYRAENPNAVAVKVRASRGRTMAGVAPLAGAQRAGTDAGNRVSLNKQIK